MAVTNERVPTTGGFGDNVGGVSMLYAVSKRDKRLTALGDGVVFFKSILRLLGGRLGGLGGLERLIGYLPRPSRGSRGSRGSRCRFSRECRELHRPKQE